jgi:hypothetical protein
MFFRHSYQSLPTAVPTTTTDTSCNERLHAHKGLQFFVFLQILFVSLCCFLVTSHESDDHTTLPWVQAFFNPQLVALTPTLAFTTYFFACLFLYSVFPTTRLWTLRLGLLLVTLGIAAFFTYFAAFSVCDPIVRLVRDNELDRILVLTSAGTVSNTITFGPSAPTANMLLVPMSTVHDLGPGWIAETIPDSFQCAANTQYAHHGRLMVIIAHLNVATAFLITTALPYFLKATFHTTPYAILLYCFVYVLTMQGITTVVINQSLWDWRMFCLCMASSIVSSYLSIAVTHAGTPTTHVEKPSSSSSQGLIPKTPPLTTLVRAAWLCIQPILALQAFVEWLDDEDTSAWEQPTPVEAIPYHV